ncbi:MAG: hypothetical protein WC670_10875 [Pseudolabrys sp.]|jgi:hypothetical protein
MKAGKSALVLTLVSSLALAGLTNRAQALPAPPPVVGGGTAIGSISWAAGGILGVAAALCLYDLVMKINGTKNWDGTAKVTAKPKAR